MGDVSEWARPFRATYRFRRVSRSTWEEAGPVAGMLSGGTVSYDADGTASSSLPCVRMLDLGGDLLRVWLVGEPVGGGGHWERPLGTFAVDQPRRTVGGARQEAEATLASALSLMDRPLPSTLAVPAGADPAAYAGRLARSCGLRCSVEATPQRLPETRVYGLDGSDTALSAARDLAAAGGLEGPLPSPMGAAVFRRPRADGAAPDWSVREGPGCRLLREVSEEADWEGVCNCVKVLYSDSGGCVVASARNDDPADPLSTVGLGREVWRVVEPEARPTQEGAAAIASRELRRSGAPARRLTLRHVYFPLQVGDALAVDYPSAGVTGTYGVEALSYDLSSPGCVMTITARG